MEDTKKTKVQLIAELQDLRGRIAEFEKASKNNKNEEETRTKYNELIQSIVLNSEDVIVVQDAEGKYLFYNGPSLYGIDPVLVIGKKPQDFFDPDIANQLMENLKKVIESGNRIFSERRVKWLGKIFWFSEQRTPIKDSSGKVKSVVTIARNITELKEAEELLKASESELKKQKLALEQKTIALREVISEIEEEKDKIKDDIITNVQKVLFPILERLEFKENSKYIDLLKHHLEKIVSTFGKKITRKDVNLTTREIEICTMVESGLNNKEISKLLSISCHTVEKHRNRIRNKFNITNKNINLSTFLQQK